MELNTKEPLSIIDPNASAASESLYLPDVAQIG